VNFTFPSPQANRRINERTHCCAYSFLAFRTSTITFSNSSAPNSSSATGTASFIIIAIMKPVGDCESAVRVGFWWYCVTLDSTTCDFIKLFLLLLPLVLLAGECSECWCDCCKPFNALYGTKLASTEAVLPLSNALRAKCHSRYGWSRKKKENNKTQTSHSSNQPNSIQKQFPTQTNTRKNSNVSSCHFSRAANVKV
uniref:Uncharacterized protein n=1 Tax=Glossina palpalis gambiensis TaxID=67801 RepID=A0A1B0C0S6_9MUSC